MQKNAEKQLKKIKKKNKLFLHTEFVAKVDPVPSVGLHTLLFVA